MRFDKNQPLLFDWRSLMGDASAGQWGKHEYLSWLPKKTANAMHEFWGEHFPNFDRNDFPVLPDDRRRIENLHGKLPMTIVSQLLEKLIMQRIGKESGHFHFSKCLHLGHRLFIGKLHIRSLPLPKQQFNGYVFAQF